MSGVTQENIMVVMKVQYIATKKLQQHKERNAEWVHQDHRSACQRDF